MEFIDIENLMMYHHTKLQELSVKYRSDKDVCGLEGNIFTFDGQQTTEWMKNKMINIFYLAKECKKNVLEIGFNAGNSALVFLMANNRLKIHAVDIGIHSYLEPCVEYLNKHFDNRVILHKGDSLNVLPSLDRKLSQEISVYHIDGWHAEEGIKADMKNCYAMAQKGSYVIVDDCENCILTEYDIYKKEGKLIDRPDKIIKHVPQWPHRIAQFI